MRTRRLTPARLAALSLGVAYAAMAAAGGGLGGFVVSIPLVAGGLIFIWFGAEVGEALSLSPGRPGAAGLVIQGTGWLLLVGLALGLALHTFG